ncbi:MAG: hypothetical protein ABF792_04785 [Bifidobacterium psychraerophilum]|uniref:hypothetical protein n=1 Tax=Bifidobacterium psychraerophilum TaxID=218140 RepID=UPI0039EAB18D
MASSSFQEPIGSTSAGASVKHTGTYLPFSYQLGVPGRLFIAIISGFLAAAVAGPAHRMGAASNIPYGLVLALLLVGLSAWAARSRSGVLGAGFHLLSSSAMAWLMAFPGPGGDVLVPVGGKGVFLSFFGLHAGYIWLFGVIVVQLVMLVFPQRWYQVHTVKRQADDTAADALVSDSVVADSVAADSAVSDSVVADSAVLDNQASGDPRTQS